MHLYTFYDYCRTNDLESLKKMHKEYLLTKKFVTSGKNYAFRESCSRGYTEICKWLYVTFDFNYNDIKILNNDCLFWACAYNHLDTIQFLMETGAFTNMELSNIRDKLSKKEGQDYVALCAPVGYE